MSDTDVLGTLTVSDFSQHVGEKFRLEVDGSPSLEVELIEARELPQRQRKTHSLLDRLARTGRSGFWSSASTAFTAEPWGSSISFRSR